MKTRLSIPIDTVHSLPYDREYSEVEAIVQVVYDIETQQDWSILKYAKKFQWSRNKVELFLEKRKLKERLEGHRRVTNSKQSANIKDRKTAFGEALIPYLKNGEVKSYQQYAKEEIRNFFDYWSEIDKRGRMRFENEQYFDIPRRLSTAKRLIWDKYGVDQLSDVSKEGDALLQYCKSYHQDHSGLVQMIKASKKSEEIKKFALAKLGEINV